MRSSLQYSQFGSEQDGDPAIGSGLCGFGTVWLAIASPLDTSEKIEPNVKRARSLIAFAVAASVGARRFP
jgi:hypothetical protein